MTTGERIRLVRKQQKMNQTEFAKEISVSTTTISQLEIGKFNIARTTKSLLCNRFHVNPVWLETGEGEMYSSKETVDGIVPEIVEILNDNPAVLKAIVNATKCFSVDDWKKLNTFIEMLGEDK